MELWYYEFDYNDDNNNDVDNNNNDVVDNNDDVNNNNDNNDNVNNNNDNDNHHSKLNNSNYDNNLYMNHHKIPYIEVHFFLFCSHICDNLSLFFFKSFVLLYL